MTFPKTACIETLNWKERQEPGTIGVHSHSPLPWAVFFSSSRMRLSHVERKGLLGLPYWRMKHPRARHEGTYLASGEGCVLLQFMELGK